MPYYAVVAVGYDESNVIAPVEAETPMEAIEKVNDTVPETIDEVYELVTNEDGELVSYDANTEIIE